MLSARPAGCLAGAARKQPQQQQQQQQHLPSGGAASARHPRRTVAPTAAAAAGGSALRRRRPAAARPPTALRAQLKAIIFDCDGVLLESEELHRTAYNAAFAKFAVSCPGDGTASGSACPANGLVAWSAPFYDVLQNTVGGGKPKMRWYFAREGWPSSLGILPPTERARFPAGEDEEAKLVDALQDFKSAEFRRLIGSGEVPPRPGVLRLMDAARAEGLRVAVCSAATRESCVFTVRNLLGEARFEGLDVFMAGDDVPRKKPDPMIYSLAAERLGLDPSECVVVEDSMVGLNAARGASMRCVITTTASTADQPFPGAALVVSSLEQGAAGGGGGGGPVTVETLRALVAADADAPAAAAAV